MESENLILKAEGSVVRITLNRPEKRNSLSHALMTDLIATLKGLGERDPVPQVVILEGAGPCFSAGHDLSEMTGRTMAFYLDLFT
ncbi:MAG: enoyl-CoA hydratase-related protein, partial [Actinomycetota bacterium]